MINEINDGLTTIELPNKCWALIIARLERDITKVKPNELRLQLALNNIALMIKIKLRSQGLLDLDDAIEIVKKVLPEKTPTRSLTEGSQKGETDARD